MEKAKSKGHQEDKADAKKEPEAKARSKSQDEARERRRPAMCRAGQTPPVALNS